MTYEQKWRCQHIYSVRPGLTLVQVRLHFAASGAVEIADGYGNAYNADDVIRTSGDEKHAMEKNHVCPGLVHHDEWWTTARPDHEGTTAPLTKTATGTYTLRFDDKYLGLSGFKWGCEDGSNTKKNNVILVSFTAADTSGNAGRSSCIIKFISNGDAAVDPDNDSRVWLEFALKTSEQG